MRLQTATVCALSKQFRNARRLILVGIGALAVVCAQAPIAMSATMTLAEASSDARLNSELRRILRTINETGTAAVRANPGDETAGAEDPTQVGIRVIIKGAFDRARLEALGGVVETEAGDLSTARIPPGAVPALLDEPNLQGIDAATELEPMLNVSVPDTDVPTVWQKTGTPPVYNGLSGRNVIVGIVDTGIDIHHKDFKTLANKTRIKYLWNQLGTVGTHPPGFTFGVEWTAAQIDAGLCTQVDSDGHGTTIAGIAAGNGSATGNGFLAYRYIGVAPEADLVVVNSSRFDSDVIDGVNYIFQKAASLGKPAVVLLAVAGRTGGHDGSSSLDQAISNLTGSGKLVVAAVGNYGGMNIHSRLNLSNNQSGFANFQIPTYTEVTWDPEQVELEYWHETNATYQVKLTSPRGSATAWINPGTSSPPAGIVTPDGVLLVENDMTTSVKGGKLIHIGIYDGLAANPPGAGTWRVDFKRITGTVAAPLDGWVSYRRLPGNIEPTFTASQDPTCLVGTPATGDNVIGVGAYTTKTSWTNVSGSTSSYPSPPPNQAIAPFSAPGPRRNGTVRPDLTAPGYCVMSTFSEDSRLYTSNVWIAEDNVHRIRYGTSAAAAHVAGALALLLQQNATLTPSSARSLLMTKTRVDTYTTTQVPNATWGYGKLDMSPNGVAAVGDVIQNGLQFARVYPNPARGQAFFDFAIPSELVRGNDLVRLRIFDLAGREVAQVAGQNVSGPQRLSWNGTMSSGHEAPAGMYLVRLEVGTRNAVHKFILTH